MMWGYPHGLAWTSVGGVTMQVEVNMMPGKGEIRLTGQLGDVMKESAMTGVSYIRSVSSRYRLPENTFTEYDFHIHIPEGAVPKDGCLPPESPWRRQSCRRLPRFR